ncbi:MAG: hypothetical protein U9Q84_00480 [Thermodesulfobacteriota bacterium]|nr:hypothetical protein [Thermodesulfobacteriota bacterium]
MATVSFVASSATTYDLTSTTVNAEAVAEITPREGGFVSRNRINFANVTAPTLTDKVMNVLKLLKVPARSVINNVYLVGPRGTAGVTHNCNSQTIASGTAGIGFIAYKSASLSASNVSTDANGFAQATLIKSKLHNSSIVSLPTDPETSPKGSIRHIAVDIAGATHGWADGAGDGQAGMHFPYGGYVTFQVLAGKASSVSASSLDGEFSGILEIAATGWKIPE